MGRPRQEMVVACEALAAGEPRLAAIIAEVGTCDLRRGRPRREHFAELARAILYQQLAGKAAAAIHGRFEALYGEVPTPEAVVATPVNQLRAAGLSGSKAVSVQDLAAKVLDGTVELDRMARLDDETVIAELTTVRGIGRWTAEMFLIFQLGRLDVWPVDDYGVRKGYALLHTLREPPLPKQLLPLGDPYRPYRSVAAWYCWRMADTRT